jgi:hypothetical protein
MKCSYHPEVESSQVCTVCKRFLCDECTHTIKGKPYCENCLNRGVEWITAFKDIRLPADAPKRAALCALVPGLGAVYNTEYLKAVTYFSVWAALAALSGRVSGIFGMGAFVFIIFTMFDAYRSAEARIRRQINDGAASIEAPSQDKAYIAWGLFLIVLGILFLLQNIIPYHFLRQYWPLVFIAFGAYLVYRSLADRQDRARDPYRSYQKSGEDN